MKRTVWLLAAFFVLSVAPAQSDILIESSNGVLVNNPAITTMAQACAQGFPVHVTTALNSSFSNISSASVHNCTPQVIFGPKGSLGNTTVFRFNAPPTIADNSQHFTGAGRITGMVVAKPEMFGAVGNGIVDDTISVVRAVTALASTGGKLIVSSLYKLTSPFTTPDAHIEIVGEGGFGRDMPGFTSSTSDLIHLGNHVAPDMLVMKNLYLHSALGGGNILTANGEVAGCVFDTLYMQQDNDAKSIYKHPDSNDFVDNLITNSWFYHTYTATVPSWDFSASKVGWINSNTWFRDRFNTATVNIGNSDHAAGGWQLGNVFRDINLEAVDAGWFNGTSCMNTLFDHVEVYDLGGAGRAAVSHHIIEMATDGTSLAGGTGTTIRNYVRQGGTLGAGVNDISFGFITGPGGIVIGPVMAPSGSAVSIDVGGNTGQLNLGTSNYILTNNTGATQLWDGSKTWFGKKDTDSVAGIYEHLSSTVTWNPGTVANGAVASTTVNVTGAALGDTVAVGSDNLGGNNIILTGFVQSAGVVRVLLYNLTGAGFTPGSNITRADVWRH